MVRNFDSSTLAKIPNDAILSLRAASDLTILMSSTMSRRGTLAATHVAKLPQGNRRGTQNEPGIRACVQNGTSVQRPNMRFAGYRGLQLPSHHHTSTRRMIPRLALTPTGTQRNGTAIGSLLDQRFHPALLRQYIEIRGTRISAGDGGL
jgi:hypothetical protein